MKSQNYLNRLKWIILVGGSLFFFIRAIGLAITGGDCFGMINPVFSWFLLLSEIFISGTAAITGFIGLISYMKNKMQKSPVSNPLLQNIILVTGILAYAIHFVRVAIWIILCVI